MLLRPASERLLPSVAMAYESPMTHETALLLVRRFLSPLRQPARARLPWLDLVRDLGGDAALGEEAPRRRMSITFCRQ